MAFKLVNPVKKDFFLPELDGQDEAAPSMISVRSATQGDVTSRNDMFSEFQRSYGTDGTIMVKQRLSFDDVRRHEVWRTLAGCNFIDGDTGKALFEFRDDRLADKVTFERAWAKLPPKVANLIHAKVLEMNPQWTDEGEPANMGE